MGIKQQIRDVIEVEKQETSIEQQIEYAFKNNLNVVFYRLPNQFSVKIMIGSSQFTSNLELLINKNGFVIQSFNKQKESLFIQNQSERTFLLDDIKKLNEANINFYFNQNNNVNVSRSEFENLVSLCIIELENEHFKKLVAARTLVEKRKINPITSFVALCEKYPNAFVSLTSTKEYGTWLGATPELLVSEEGNCVRTVALAGTQLYSQENNEKTAGWKTKEIEEQALVSRYIINKFKSIRLREFEDVGPKTVKAGNLLHLKTEFQIDKKEVGIENLALKIAQLLHPTSAVCGMPQEEAMTYIQKHEHFDRSIYAGFFGIISANDKALFVNLRCVQLHENTITFYAGAGITKDSNPTKEWEETNNKIDTLKSVLL